MDDRQPSLGLPFRHRFRKPGDDDRLQSHTHRTQFSEATGRCRADHGCRHPDRDDGPNNVKDLRINDLTGPAETKLDTDRGSGSIRTKS
jgi:hypothetical protein